MKIKDFNKENALSVKNNIGLESERNAQNWISSYMEFDFKELVINENLRVWIGGKYRDKYVVTDLKDNIIHWFSVYNFLNRYETKYEYVFVGHERNYHVDKQTGDMNSYEW